MAGTTIKLEGLKELQKKLGQLEGGKIYQGVLEAAARDVQGKTSRYPPSTEANSPNNSTGHWYERGYGSKWKDKDGSEGGKKTSETLSKKWSVKIEKYRANVMNTASYAPYIHGRETQVAWARERGWQTLEEVAELEIPEIERKLASNIEALLRKD